MAAFPRHAAGVGRHPDLWVPSHTLYASDNELRNGTCDMMKRAFMDNTTPPDSLSFTLRSK